MPHRSLANQPKSKFSSCLKRRAWLLVAKQVLAAVILGLPALTLPVALITQVEDKQSTMVLFLALSFSTLSLILLVRLMQKQIDLTLSNPLNHEQA